MREEGRRYSYFLFFVYIIPSFLYPALIGEIEHSLTLPSPTTSLPVPQETLVREREAKGQALLART